MRLALLFLVLISVAAPAYAEGARESRYGPATPRQASGAAASYTGPLLGWSSRQAPSAAPVSATLPARPAPIAPWARYQPVGAVASPPMVAAPTQPLPQPPPKSLARSATSALPDSLYAAPRGATAPAQPAPPRQQVAAVSGTTGARFYSVGRESGLTPDPIPPIAPDNRVLISAEVPAAAPEDAAPAHGSADWLAAGVAGDDDQDSGGDRRAKTRNQDQ